MTYMAIFTEEKSGGFSVSIPALPGCFSEGESFEEAKKNIGEAIELYLEDEDISELNIGSQIVAQIEVKQHA